MSQSALIDRPAKISFSRFVEPGVFMDVASVETATGITLWRNSEKPQTWKKLVERMQAKFGEDFHEYEAKPDRYTMLRNRERDAREVLSDDAVPF